MGYVICEKHGAGGTSSVSNRVWNIVRGSSAGNAMDIRLVKLFHGEFESLEFVTDEDIADLHQIGGVWNGSELCEFPEEEEAECALGLLTAICPRCLEEILMTRISELVRVFNQRNAIVPTLRSVPATIAKISEIAGPVDFTAVLRRNDFAKPALDILELAIREGDINRFLRRDGNMNQYTREVTGALQSRIKDMTEQSREFYGFEESIAVISCLDEAEKISWAGIQTSTHLLILLIAESSYNVVGCMSIKSVVQEQPVFLPGLDESSDGRFWPSFYLVQAATVASHNQPDHLYLIKVEGVGIIGYSKKFNLCTSDIAAASTAETAPRAQWFGFDHRWRWCAATLEEIREAQLDKYLVGSKKHISMKASIEPVIQDGEPPKQN